MFDAHLARWRLKPDGAPIRTHSSDLLPVRLPDGLPGMLKCARAPEERAGAALMHWWKGAGSARVLASTGEALLLERATGHEDLLVWALRDATSDDAASRVICSVLDRLHAPRNDPPPSLSPLRDWFDALQRAASAHGGVLAACSDVAQQLLATERDLVPLHGDCHHRNVLDFGRRGWLAIDPKDRIGERAFDHALILCNPDLPHAADAARFTRQLSVVSEAGRLASERLARWVAARAGLSAVWFLEDGDVDAAAHDIAIASTALGWLRAQPVP